MGIAKEFGMSQPQATWKSPAGNYLQGFEMREKDYEAWIVWNNTVIRVGTVPLLDEKHRPSAE